MRDENASDNMNKNIWKVVTQYANQEAIMNNLSASDSSAFAYAFGISTTHLMRIKYFNPLRDMPELLDWFMQMYAYGHKIVLVGRDVPRLLHRILHPDKYDYSNKSPIWLWPMVVSRIEESRVNEPLVRLLGMEQYEDRTTSDFYRPPRMELTNNDLSGLVYPYMHLNTKEYVDKGRNWNECTLRNVNGIRVVFADQYYAGDVFSRRMSMQMTADPYESFDPIMGWNGFNWYNAHSMTTGVARLREDRDQIVREDNFTIAHRIGTGVTQTNRYDIPIPK